MREFGVFNDEGMIDGGFLTLAEAEKRIQDEYPEDDCEALEMCEQHHGEPNISCEECLTEED